MSQSVNGLGFFVDPSFNAGEAVDVTQPCFAKAAAVTNPAPTRLFVFIDENEGTLEDDQFGYPMINSGYNGYWFDMPSNRHNQGGDLSFADGHAEYWPWKSPMIATIPAGSGAQRVTTAQMPDYIRIGSAMRQKPIDGTAD
jgi:prepilin-type processing-associated H-X9-DG protein